MKKIIILLSIIFITSSCGIINKENGEEKKEKIVKQEIKEPTKQEKLMKLEDQINKQKFDKAIPELEKMYNQNPEDLDNILNYSQALLAKGSITRQEKEYSKKAIEILNKALEKYPNESEIYRLLGYANEIAENYKDAFENYDKAIELNPKNALAYANRGHAYRLYGDYAKAEESFEKAYELNPNDDFVLINLAWIYDVILFDLDRALKYYEKVVNITKNIRFKSEAYHSIGYIYLGKNKPTKAKEAFKKSIEADEKFELGYLGLSEALMLDIIKNEDKLTKKQKGELLKEALKNNDIAIALNPGRAMSYFKKGLILKDLKGYEEEAKLMFKIALDASKVDITLGKKEKKGLQDYINNILKNENK